MRSFQIRNEFINFFKKNTHQIMDSAPVIPNDDPTLLFVNAGMVAFKNYFTRKLPPPHERVASIQKCIRAGGKHNDLENVGYTTRHHTFFEMMGNFSFGDYFKEEAIHYAWEFITKTLGINPNKLYITVYETDTESGKIWLKHISKDHLFFIKGEDNFWSMGDHGPCGPSSEIFYDYGEKFSGEITEFGVIGERYVEIWNLVFMQYEKQKNGEQTLLPHPCIDTGIGLERISALLQNTHNNYETDLFLPLANNIIESTQKPLSPSHYVIADHIRSVSFMISEGITPSSEARGYVLRRIIRRAVRHLNFLGIKEPLFYSFFDTLEQLMGTIYPELKQYGKLIKETIYTEEENFHQTLERGIKYLNLEIQKLDNKEILEGSVAFKLYDTYGFPLDLTQDILREHQKKVDTKAFETCMKEQKEKGKSHIKNDLIFDNISLFSTEFIGYKELNCESSICSLVNTQGKEVTELHDKGYFITKKTPFYARAGGQEGDQGTFQTQTTNGIITNTFFYQEMIIHTVEIKEGHLKQGDIIKLSVDKNRRKNLSKYHSATHLLHAALRKILGEHVFQKGSLVDAHKLRFDFSHKNALTKEESAQIEYLMNEWILNNLPVQTRIMSYKEAIANGVMALFGEKYKEDVRVLTIGEVSIELCGGTHVNYTGEIGLFKITSQSVVSSGIRRVEALVGLDIISYINEQKELLALEKEKIKKHKKNEQNISEKTIAFKCFTQNDLDVYYAESNIIEAKKLKEYVDLQKTKIEKGIIVLITNDNNKTSFVVGVKNTAFDALKLVKHLSVLSHGKGGGGRCDMAQGGGTRPIKNLETELKKFVKI